LAGTSDSWSYPFPQSTSGKLCGLFWILACIPKYDEGIRIFKKLQAVQLSQKVHLSAHSLFGNQLGWNCHHLIFWSELSSIR
jgi:hypothetical protein